jgi:hypothetical protein
VLEHRVVLGDLDRVVGGDERGRGGQDDVPGLRPEELKNGGLWCSPRANTSRPTSSACLAMVTTAEIRSCSLGVTPVVGWVVMSLTEKMPNCMS